MAGGQKISDHSFWAGGKSKGSVFPEGVKHKMESSASDAGHESYYEDTTEAIKKQQDMGAGKAKAHPLKDGYRN
jgi:hypothetical protein